MIQDIYQNDEEQKQAREFLPNLITDAGWKLVVKALDANIEYLSDELKNRIENKRDFETLDELYYLQDRIDDFKQMKELPSILLAAAQPEPDEEDTEIY